MDVEDYSVIGARSSTEELSHSGLYKSKERLLSNSTPMFLTDEELTEQPSSVR